MADDKHLELEGVTIIETIHCDTVEGLEKAFKRTGYVVMDNGMLLFDSLIVWDPKKDRKKQMTSLEQVILEYKDQLKNTKTSKPVKGATPQVTKTGVK